MGQWTVLASNEIKLTHHSINQLFNECCISWLLRIRFLRHPVTLVVATLVSWHAGPKHSGTVVERCDRFHGDQKQPRCTVVVATLVSRHAVVFLDSAPPSCYSGAAPSCYTWIPHQCSRQTMKGLENRQRKRKLGPMFFQGVKGVVIASLRSTAD